MQEAKLISRKDYAKVFLGIGAFLMILGIVFNFILDPNVFYDLPMYVGAIGIGALIYGAKQLFDKNNQDVGVTFSSKTVKEFFN